MKKYILLLFSCFLLSLCCWSQKKDCDVLFKSAIEHYNNGEYELAMSCFNRIIEKCGEGGDYRGSLSKIEDCKLKINSSNVTFYLEKNEISFGPQGGMEIVEVSSNASWSYYKGPDWLHFSQNTGQLVIECDENASGEFRNAEITLVVAGSLYKKLYVSQTKSSLSVNTTSVPLPEYGGTTFKINVNSNDDWDVVARGNTWFSLKKSDKIVMVSSDANPSIEERRGAFKIVTSNNASVEITVSQKGSKPKLEVDSIVNIAWNAEDYILHVNSNDPKWSAEVKSGCAWCKIVKRKDQQLELSFKENDTDNSRTAVVRITTQNMPPKDVTITQGVYGYMALYEDYFRNIGGTKRITKLSGSAYVIGSYGLRFSSYMIRWKVAEIDLLNVNMSFSKSFLLSWEPMIRGYLPLQRDGRRWTAYCGFGRCFPIVDTPLNGAVAASHSKVLLELGAECRLPKYDGISARLFLRIDGNASIGVALDMCQWK